VAIEFTPSELTQLKAIDVTPERALVLLDEGSCDKITEPRDFLIPLIGILERLDRLERDAEMIAAEKADY
jgi:hypothetical protein